ncbi:hypothetical protein [Flagellimonas nanhaiensis]|nr:hypothetical protein [Allomuricauda nanhaiensis]
MKKVIILGEVMLRLSPPGFLRFSLVNNFETGAICFGMVSKPALKGILIKRQLDLFKKGAEQLMVSFAKSKRSWNE